MKKSTLLTLTSAAALLAFSTAAVQPALAQQTDAGGLEEIIVTAQKRAENVQTVPVAVSVIGAETLAASGITNIESLQEVVPSLTFTRRSTSQASALNIRGIGTQSFASGAEPSVSTVLDGVVLGRAGMALAEFTDITRIEVLRGPQATLFGKNASAGVVSIITQPPSDTFEGKASLGFFEGNEKHANINVSGPVGDKVGVRLAGVYTDYRGNAFNFANSKWANGSRRIGLRGKIVGEASDDFKFTFSLDHLYAHDDCCGDVLGANVPNAQWTNVFLQQLAPVVPGPTNTSIKNDFTPLEKDTNQGASLQLDWTVADHTITSISAYRRWKAVQHRDGDFHATFANYVASLDLLQHDVGETRYKQYSEELRLASPQGQAFEYVLGGFLWHTNNDDVFERSVQQCTASTLPADATTFQPCRAGASTYLVTSGPAAWNTQFDNSALFGQGTFNVSDSFRLIAGGRYIHDKVEFRHARTNNPTTGPGIGAPVSLSGSTSKNGWSAKAGGQFDVADDIMAYVTYSRGYKGPAINVFYNMTANNLTPISSETSDAYEAGFKSRLADNRLQLNIAAYTQKFKGFQANSFVLLNGAVITNLTSAGTVRSQGIETEFVWRPVNDVNISGGYTYNVGKILAYNCPSTLSAAQLVTCQAHNGKPLPFAPKNKLTAMGDWRLPLGAGSPVNVNLNTSYVYTSWTNFDIDQTPLANQAGYGLWNASIVFASQDEAYKLTVMVKNITDKFYTAFKTPVGNGVAALSYTRNQIPRDASRYFGATFGVAF